MVSAIRASRTAFPRKAAWCAAFAAFSALGCGGGEFAVTPAKGKVVCGGKPVSVGTVVFTPVGGEASGEDPGKPATATLKSDGTFVLSTYDAQDGAVVGKHRVQYFAPEGEDEEEGAAVEEGSAEERQQNAERASQRRAALASLCVQQGEMTVEVTEDGPNEFTVELVPASQAGSSAEQDPAD